MGEVYRLQVEDEWVSPAFSSADTQTKNGGPGVKI